MRNILFKDTIQEIKKTKGRFFSIFAIVMIGVAFFAGIMSCGMTMRLSADRYFDEYNLMDYRILSNFGITDDDIKEIEKIDGVEAVLPAYEKDVLTSVNQKETVVRVHSLDLKHLEQGDKKYINQINVIEGRLPKKSGECIVELSKISDNGIKVGDTLTIRSGKSSDDIRDTFKTTAYKVVGLMHTPYYLSQEKGTSDIGGGSVQYYMYVPSSDFDMDVYTECYVSVKDADQFNSYTQEYFDYIKPITTNLETLGIKQSDIRRNDILNEAQKAYDEGYQEYQDGLEEFNNKIEEAQKALDDGKFDLLEGKMTLQSKKDSVKVQMDLAASQIEASKEQIKTLESAYNSALEEYNKANSEILSQKEKLESELNVALEDKNKAQAEYDSALEAYNIIQEYSKCKEDNIALSASNDLLLATNDTLKLNNEELQRSIDENNNKLNNPDISEDEKIVLIKANELYQGMIDSNNAAIIANENTINDNNEKIEANNVKIAEFEQKYPNITSQDVITIQADMELKKQALDVANTKVDALNKAIAAIDETTGKAYQAVDLLKQQIDSGYAKIEEANRQLEEGKAQAEEEFAKAEVELKNAEQKLINGKVTLAKEKAKGEQELEDAREELVKAKEKISQIEEAKWFVLDRHSHYSYVDYEGACERIENIAKVFPVFFYVVAALVCLTTMTRMVDEQRGQIGTLKALGYRTSQIAFKYVFYAGFASFTGSIIGLSFGIFVFPAIIYTAWNMMYLLPSTIVFAYEWDLMILSTIISMLVTTLAAFMACYKELIETPSLLMRPKAPQIGKKIVLEKIDFIWKRFSFTSKVTARNIFRYKNRFFMTVIGISGCTALLMAGFGIKDSINTIIDKQFNDLWNYTSIVSLKDDVEKDRKEEIVEEIIESDIIEDAYLTYTSNASVTFDNKKEDVTLTVVDDIEGFERFVDLHNRKSQEKLSLSSDGVIITERIANAKGIKVGDDILITNADGIERSFEVVGISENYINHFVYMTSGAYSNNYDLSAKENTIWLNIAQEYSHDDSYAAGLIAQYDEVQGVSFYTSIIENFQSMIKSLNYIVVVLIICAGALAFVVLYNLTNVNISERTREIATLMVLGFTDKEVNQYVYKENIILTFIGSLLGLVVGKILHLTIMVVVELDYIMFGRNIEPISYLYSVIITVLFAVIVNQVMKKKLRNIPMVESLKSVE